MNKKGQEEIIFIVLMLLVGALFVYIYIDYNNKHPCIEEKEFCYYLQTTSGSGPMFTGKGMGMGFYTGTTKVYTECNNTIAPNIRKEMQCVARKDE